eukprot:363337-Chlamydomonas_euryale.AAC.6
MALTEFADLTEDEFAESRLGLRPDLLRGTRGTARLGGFMHADVEIKGAVDWLAEGAVTGVKNQGSVSRPSHPAPPFPHPGGVATWAACGQVTRRRGSRLFRLFFGSADAVTELFPLPAPSRVRLGASPYPGPATPAVRRLTRTLPLCSAARAGRLRRLAPWRASTPSRRASSCRSASRWATHARMALAHSSRAPHPLYLSPPWALAAVWLLAPGGQGCALPRCVPSSSAALCRPRAQRPFEPEEARLPLMPAWGHGSKTWANTCG